MTALTAVGAPAPEPERIPRAAADDEEEVAAGLLPFTIDGTTRLVPELKWRANRAWTARMREVFATLVGLDPETPEGVEAMGDAERELVLAYDATHALGDLEDATEREVSAVYSRLVEVAFPQASSQTAIVVMIARRAVEAARRAAESAPASSTSSPSPSGTSGPTPSRSRSRSARSSSTTRRPRSA